MYLTHKIFFIFISLVPLLVFALPTDSSKNMHIDAASTLFNYKTGFDVFEGNVKVDQGATNLTADKLTTQRNKNHKIQEAIAYGDKEPAHYWTIPNEGDQVFNAYAKIIKFYPLESKVLLQGDVVVTQGNNSFHGPEIIYNIKDQTVTSLPSKQGRATIIIEPSKLDS